jgi:DNA-binding transcriptional MocR family regulator
MRRAPPQLTSSSKPHSPPDSPWEPICRLDITTAILERIESLLESGQLKPDSRLPPERQLAEILRVSPPSLRQALKFLALLGVVKSRVGVGQPPDRRLGLRPSPSESLRGRRAKPFSAFQEEVTASQAVRHAR